MSSISSYILARLMILPGIIIGLSFHEFAHAKSSDMLGDPTPRSQGRVSLNPIAHIDPVGFIALLLLGFGWGKPVQINPNYYKHRRRDEIIVGLAGVVMNLVVAIVTAIVLRILILVVPDFFATSVGGIFTEIFIDIIQINLVLMIFNLIPLPPLDGFGIITQLFRLDTKPWYYRFYNLGPMILLLVIIFNLTDYIISPAVSRIYYVIISLIF